jgi:glucose/arabinose dehydrogenase
VPLTRAPLSALLAGPLAALLAGLLTGCGADAAPTGTPPAATATSQPGSPSAQPPAAGGPPQTVRPTPLGEGALDLSAPQVIATGLQAPWGLAFLPSGDALVSERDRARILRIPAAGGAPVEVMRLPETDPGGEGGLLGIAVSPDYRQDGLVYAYLTAAEDNRIVRFRLGGPVETVLTGIPKAAIHNGGRLAFGPDGNLYAGTGDAGDTDLAQDDMSLGGKVLRMTPDGKPVDGTLVLSKGHRNVQGLAFDESGRLYAVEFGQNRFDEVNQIGPGTNGGWPLVEGPGDGGGRFLAPIVTWDPAEASPSGADIVGTDLYVAALRGQRLWQVPLLGEGRAGRPRALFAGEYGRLRAAQRAPDGSLWVLTSNRDGRGDPVRDDDRVLRLPTR